MNVMNELSQIEQELEVDQISRIDLTDAVRSTALLANLSINLWSGERTDPQIGAQLKADAGAVGNTGRYIKNLLAGCDTELRDLRGAYTMARTLHYKLTLPWVSDPTADRQSGRRLLPNMLFMRYVQEMGALRQAAEDKRTTFVADYPRLVSQAMANLAGLARPEDYPTADQVRDSFKLHFDFEPIPPASAFPNMSDDMLTALSRGLQKRQMASVRAAEAAMWERVRTHVGHLVSRLADRDAMFKEATVENVRELVTLLPSYNCTGDVRVDEVVADIRAMLDGIDAKDIRKHAEVRGDVQAKAQAITDKMAQWGL